MFDLIATLVEAAPATSKALQKKVLYRKGIFFQESETLQQGKTLAKPQDRSELQDPLILVFNLGRSLHALLWVNAIFSSLTSPIQHMYGASGLCRTRAGRNVSSQVFDFCRGNSLAKSHQSAPLRSDGNHSLSPCSLKIL